jgi:hypothetical protein
MTILIASIFSLLLCGVYYFFIEKGFSPFGKVFLFTVSVFCFLLSLLAAAGYSFWYGLAVGIGASLCVGILASSRLSQRLTIDFDPGEGEGRNTDNPFEEREPKFNLTDLLEKYHSVEEPEEEFDIAAEEKKVIEKQFNLPTNLDHNDEEIEENKYELTNEYGESEEVDPLSDSSVSAPLITDVNTIEISDEDIMRNRISLLVSEEESDKKNQSADILEGLHVKVVSEQEDVEGENAEDQEESIESLLRTRRLIFDSDDILEEKKESDQVQPQKENEPEKLDPSRFEHFDDLKVEYENKKKNG